tara:strand:- start:232 stop:636 length:405 start_codon:yes stop_codon:yes gene_type:complete
MKKTGIVTSFLKHNDMILILKRSDKVKTMKGLWAGVSGIIENSEPPIERAKIEIFEELGIEQQYIRLIKSAKELTIESPQYEGHQWVIFPFLFATEKSEIKLNWENSEFRWINANQLKEFNTVSSLEKVLFSVL